MRKFPIRLLIILLITLPMKFKKLGSERLINYKISKYRIDWEKQIQRGGKKNFGVGQLAFKNAIYPFWKEDVVYEEFIIPSSNGKSLDFLNLTRRVAVEYSGVQHIKQTNFFHGNKFHFFKQLKNDLFKQNWCEHNGLLFVEIYTDDPLTEQFFKSVGIA